MKHYKNFKNYMPESPLGSNFPLENIDNPHLSDADKRRHHLMLMSKTELDNGMKVLFQQADCGTCWYDAMLQFSIDTIKIVYDPMDGKVVSFDKDAQKLFPHGNNVIEVESVPDEFNNLIWKIDIDTLEIGHYDAAIVRVNRLRQTALLRDSSAHLIALSAMTDRNEKEEALLKALKKYVIDVRRTDISDAKPSWPKSVI